MPAGLDHGTFRLTGEMQVIIDEQDGKRTKNIGFVQAVNSKFRSYSRFVPRIVQHDDFDEAVERVVGEYYRANEATGGV